MFVNLRSWDLKNNQNYANDQWYDIVPKPVLSKFDILWMTWMLLWKYHYFCKVKVNQKWCYFISLWSVMTPVALRSALATQVRRTKATTPSRSQTHHGYLHSDARSSKTKMKEAWISMSKIDFQAIWNKKIKNERKWEI